jgi:hypothetical protein
MITDGNRYYQCLPMVTDVLPMVTDVYPMGTDGDQLLPMVAEESSVANHQKVAKIDEKIRKIELATLLET